MIRCDKRAMARTVSMPERMHILMSIAVITALIAFLTGMAWGREEIEDEVLNNAIVSELAFSEQVSSHLIDVETVDGVVTLSGSVDNMLAKEQAIRITKSFKGVRSVIDKLNVRPVLRTDEDIADDVEIAFALDPATESYEVDVSVDDGIVTLEGTVESWTERKLAEDVAKGVKGVKEVRNEIDVTYDESRSDIEIKGEIERRLELDPYVSGRMLNVYVKDGKVELKGTVGSSAEKTHAYNNAWVAGVEGVDDDAVVVDWLLNDELKKKAKVTFKGDLEIQRDIEDAMLYDPRVHSFNIDVRVNEGIATLSGVVNNLKAKRVAEKNAQHTIGVKDVSNNIVVRPVVLPESSKLTEQVINALERDPIVERHEITVISRNNKVYLYGKVDSHYEKLHAEDVVSRIRGVVEVENNLEVYHTWNTKTDEEIEKDIENQLFWSIYVDSSDIDVSVDNGVATLSGVVGTWSEFNAVLDNAFEGGARGVESHIRILEHPVDEEWYFGYYNYPW